MYYKIKLVFDQNEEGCSWVEEYVNVDSRQEAEERIPQIAKDYEIPAKYDVDIQETSIDEMIECEKDYFHKRLTNEYIFKKFGKGTLTLREFGTLQRAYNTDKEKIYELFKDVSRYGRLCALVKKHVDTEKVSIQEFEQIVLALYNAKSNEECEKIWKEKVEQ